MNTRLKLAAAATAVAMLAGASAFADQRPQRGTRGEGGRIERGDRGRAAQTQVEVRAGRYTPRGNTEWRERARDRRNDSARESTRQRGTSTAPGTIDRRSDKRRDRGSDSRGRYETFDERRYGRGRDSFENRRYDHNRSQHYRGRPYYHHGRVSHFLRYGNGYRVWVGGARYPFFVPLAYWDPWRFRVGVSIGLGGYYNPLGYYEYYDGYRDGYRAGTYTDRRVYRTEELSGIVEDYDYRRRTALIRDDVTDRLVTVYMRTRDARLNHIRPGDFIELEGGWKGDVFEAYRLFDVD